MYYIPLYNFNTFIESLVLRVHVITLLIAASGTSHNETKFLNSIMAMHDVLYRELYIVYSNDIEYYAK